MAENSTRALQVFQVEPSMFTPPYAAGLDEGLTAAGVGVTWITRAERPHEDFGVPPTHIAPIFYRGIDGNPRIPKRLVGPLKGLSHVWGLMSFAWKALRERPDVIHYQWTVIPFLDIPVLIFLRRFVAPVVFTAHNTIPYHGDKISTFQNLGADWALNASSHIVVHTASSKKILTARAIPADKISVVPHGPHYLRAEPPRETEQSSVQRRYTFLLFGMLKPYKGFDVLVDAVGMLPAEIRAGLRVIVAGQKHMDASAILAKIETSGLSECFDLRFQRQSEEQMAALFAETDTFVFPYRFIDASGVYYYIKPMRKWIIASRVGVFQEDVVDGVTGALIAPADAGELSAAMRRAVTERPVVSAAAKIVDWIEIGAMTRDVYLKVVHGEANAGV
jgi:glycosyltransferase involved in cell wall biosynthesis